MTDYQAEAGRWLDDAAPAVPETRRERWLAINTPALAALLERLCGEKCEEIHPGFAEFRALQKDHRETVAQLSEARAEADRRVVALVDERRAYKAHIAEVESERDEARAEVAHYSAEAERLDARWTQEHVALVKAEAALEQARTRTGLEGSPCPLCKYEVGVYVAACGYHETINRLHGQRDHYKASSEVAFERGKEEGKKEAAQLVEERGRKIGGAIDPKLTAQAIRGER